MDLFDVIIDGITSLFGGSGGPVKFGRVDPDNLESYFEADWDIDQGERAEKKGQAGAHAAALATWGFKSEKEWKRAKAALHQKHEGNPDLHAALVRVNTRKGMAQAAAKHGVDPNDHPMLRKP